MGARIVGGLVRDQLLPQTGQILTAPTANYATGDDGYFQAGLPLVTRWVAPGNGTVKDLASGLTWVKTPELIIPGATGVTATNQLLSAEGDWTCVPPTAYAAGDLVAKDGAFYVCATAHTSGVFAADLAAGKWRETVWTASAADLTTPANMTWANALANSLGTAHGGTLEYAGFDDWRLPNVDELLSLLLWANVTPGTIDPLFVNVVDTSGSTGCYWSSTTWPGSPATAWGVHYRYQESSYKVRPLAKNTAYYVRPVRGGHCVQ